MKKQLILFPRNLLITMLLLSSFAPNVGFAGFKYDTGMGPSLTTLDNGDILEVHKGPGTSTTLYYNLYNFSDGTQWYSIGNKYNEGESPSVTTLDNGDILEVHEGPGDSNNLYYNLGRYVNRKVDWYSIGNKYDTGEAPSVTTLADGYVVEVHKGSRTSPLFYNLGEYDPETDEVDWYSIGNKYENTGESPSVATLNNGRIIIEVHEANSNLYYRLGERNVGTIDWYSSANKYDTGKVPFVTTFDNGYVLEIHRGPGSSDNLHYNLGRYDNEDRTIHWEIIGEKYDTGAWPSVTPFRSSLVIEAHHSGSATNNNLYYQLGQLQPNDHGGYKMAWSTELPTRSTTTK